MLITLFNRSSEKESLKDIQKCMGKAKKCEWDELYKVLEGHSDGSVGTDGIKRVCLPKCNEEEMKISQSSQPYPTKQTFKKRKEICYLFKKLVRVCNNQLKALVFEETYGNLLPCQNILEANTDEMCINYMFDYKKYPDLAEALFQYAKENMAHLKIYIKDPFYTLKTKEVQMGLDSFLGNLGGLLGIFLGLTAFGIMELLSFFLQILISTIKSKP